MMTLTSRPYRNEKDLAAMIELLLRCRMAGPISRYPDIGELRHLCHPDNRDCLKHLWIGEDERLATFALTYNNYAGLYFFIDPDRQGTTLAEQILAWAIETQRALGNEILTCQVREADVERIAFLKRQGFFCMENYTVRMTRNLTQPIPIPQLPRGFTIRPVAGEEEATSRATVHERAFGREEATAQDIADRLALMQMQNYIPELDIVAVAPDGTFVAFCQGGISQEENQRCGCLEGWTDPVGVHPDYQGQGLGKAVVLATCLRLRDLGMETAILGTGSWNKAMLGCAQSAGYKLFYKSLWYGKLI